MTIQITKQRLKLFQNQKTYSVFNGMEFWCYIPLPPQGFMTMFTTADRRIT